MFADQYVEGGALADQYVEGGAFADQYVAVVLTVKVRAGEWLKNLDD